MQTLMAVYCYLQVSIVTKHKFPYNPHIFAGLNLDSLWFETTSRLTGIPVPGWLSSHVIAKLILSQ